MGNCKAILHVELVFLLFLFLKSHPKKSIENNNDTLQIIQQYFNNYICKDIVVCDVMCLQLIPNNEKTKIL